MKMIKSETQEYTMALDAVTMHLGNTAMLKVTTTKR